MPDMALDTPPKLQDNLLISLFLINSWLRFKKLYKLLVFINGDIKIKHMNSQKVISFLLIIIYSVHTLISVTYPLLVIIHDILKDSTILLWLIHDHGLSNNLFLLLLGMSHPVILLQSLPLYRFQNHIFNILIRPPSIPVFLCPLVNLSPPDTNLAYPHWLLGYYPI